MNALSLFTGIGGLDLAAEMAGIETVAFCEIEPFPVEILKKRFPGVHIFNDVKTLTKESFMEVMLKNGGGMDASQPVDIIFGGFPCQDLSQAGKQIGLTGARSGLWFEMLRVISEFRPRYVIAENVRGAVNLALDTVYSGLVGEGYKVYPYVIPASAVGAPHQRERLFVVGVREDVHRRYTEAMENPGCELRQRAEFSGADGVETGNRDADKPERSGGTLWPTPVKEDYRRRGPNSQQQGLPEIVHKLWPTPSANEDACGTPNGKMQKILGNNPEVRKTSGQLNPDWVGQLMGYPEGWTDLDVDEPREWQGWPALLGENILWATPNCMDTLPSRSYEAMKKQALNGARKNRSRPGNLREQIDPEMCKAYEDASHENGGNVKAIEVHSQYPYEFPRTTTGCKNRAKQLKAYGNSVVPAQAYPFFKAIAEIEKTIREAA